MVQRVQLAAIVRLRAPHLRVQLDRTACLALLRRSLALVDFSVQSTQARPMAQFALLADFAYPAPVLLRRVQPAHIACLALLMPRRVLLGISVSPIPAQPTVLSALKVAIALWAARLLWTAQLAHIVCLAL